ncbi:MAG: CheR family methyltransferase [Pseudomonadota bacterium]
MTVRASRASTGRKRPPVVGIGASAGAYSAICAFLCALPPDTGFAFVLVPHPDPTGPAPDLLVSELARQAAMPVVAASDGARIEADRLYVAPSGERIAVRKGRLRCAAPADDMARALPIDHFFQSLAQDQGTRGVGIVFSGTGFDGAAGLAVIGQADGLTIVQAPDSAEYPSMPRHAIQAATPAHVLPPARIASLLAALGRDGQGALSRALPPPIAWKNNDIEEVVAAIRRGTGFDFRGYKRDTLVRRTERRINLLQAGSLDHYLKLLHEGAEARALAQDLLIGVTSFFREREAWEYLDAKVIARLVAERSPDLPLRVWVPGCATGQEAYSLAMLCIEHLNEGDLPARLQIFATDLNEEALAIARAGIYPERIKDEVPAALLRRYFIKEGATWRVSKALRSVVAFARQNLLADPPFSRLDLISCRNLLIYFDVAVQNRLMPLFHFGLQPGGVLFLGSSETIGQHQDLFEPVSKKMQVYRRLATTRRVAADFPIALPGQAPASLGLPSQPVADAPPDPALLVHRFLLAEYAPTAVLVNAKREVLFVSGATSRYLEVPVGEPSRDLLSMARPILRGKLRAAFHRCLRHGGEATIHGIRDGTDDGAGRVTIRVRALAEETNFGTLLLVTFEPEPSDNQTAPSAGDLPDASDIAVQQLEYELQVTRDDLQSTIEALEVSNEELRASNEEVTSMNEELQSTNEELETSKEELQSLNEELSTLNTQLRDKVEELEATHNDITNLFASTDVGIVFLDTELNIKRFTPAIRSLLRLLPTDIGRPIADFAPALADRDMIADAQAVLAGQTVAEREVNNRDQRMFYRRILPYRTRDGVLDGVIVTFADVTALTDANAEIATRARQAAAVVSLGTLALGRPPLQVLADAAVGTVAEHLGVEYTRLQMLSPEEHTLLTQAGVGWRSGVIGADRVDAAGDSQAAFTFRSDRPVTVVDYHTEARFGVAPLLREHGVASGVTVRVLVRGEPQGVLAAYSTRPRSFSIDDVHYVASVANLLSQAIERERFETELEQLNATLEQRVAERTHDLEALRDRFERQARLLGVILGASADAVVALDSQGEVIYANPAACSDFDIGPAGGGQGATASPVEFLRTFGPLTQEAVRRGEVQRREVPLAGPPRSALPRRGRFARRAGGRERGCGRAHRPRRHGAAAPGARSPRVGGAHPAEPEAGEPGAAGGRHRPRLQQPAAGDPGQRRSGADRHHLRGHERLAGADPARDHEGLGRVPADAGLRGAKPLGPQPPGPLRGRAGGRAPGERRRPQAHPAGDGPPPRAAARRGR